MISLGILIVISLISKNSATLILQLLIGIIFGNVDINVTENGNSDNLDINIGNTYFLHERSSKIFLLLPVKDNCHLFLHIFYKNGLKYFLLLPQKNLSNQFSKILLNN